MKQNITAGIDFGNQTSILSIPANNGIDIVLNESSNRKTPSIIGYFEGRRTSGEFAQQQQMMNISNTITNLKRLIGLQYDSQERKNISDEVPFEIVRLDNDSSGIKLDNGEILRIEQIIGFYLKSLVEIIQKKNAKIEQIVLTIPSNWTEIQRRLILNAASIANVKIVDLLDNSTASAISYAKIHNDRFPEEKEKALNVLFIEFGDTSMNTSIAKISKKSIEMKSNICDNSFGGHYFSEILEKYLIEKVIEKYKINPQSNKRSMIRFKQACEKVKKTLSSNSIVLFEVPSLMNDIDVSITVKREEFNELTKSYLSVIKENIEKAITNAGINKEDISYVEIVGGSSRIPSIKAEIKEIIGNEAKMSLDLDECFAIGAGFIASKIDGHDIGIELINKNCCPFSIDAKVVDGKDFVNVFNKNSKLPGSTKFSIPISQQQPLTFYCDQNEIGKLSIKTGSDNQTEVDVSVSIDSFGIIKINEVSIKNENQNQVQFSYTPLMTLTDDQISELEKIEEAQSQQDKLEIEIDNTKNSLESLILSTENEIKGIKSNCDANLYSAIEKNLESIHNWFEENEFERLSLNEYKSKIVILNDIKKEISKHQEKQKVFEKNQSKLVEIKQTLQKSLNIITKEEKRNNLQESIDLQSDISKQISIIDEIMKSSKDDIINLNMIDLQKKVTEIDSKMKSLSQIQVNKKQNTKTKRRHHRKKRINQPTDNWSPFGMRNSILDDFLGNPWQTRRYNQAQYQNNNEYEYEDYSYDDEKESQKQEEERKRQEFLRKQDEERKRQAYLKQKEEERKKQEFIKEQEEKRKKQEILRKQEEERKRQACLKQKDEERKKQEFLKKQEEERKKQEYIRKQQEEERKKQDFIQKREEERREKNENENRRKAQIEQDKIRCAKENNRINDINDDFSYLDQMKKESQQQAKERKQEQLQRQEQERQKIIEMENRKRVEMEQEKIRRAKEAEMQRRERSMIDPWSTSMLSPYGRNMNQRQSYQPRKYLQQQRRVMPGYGYPWGF